VPRPEGPKGSGVPHKPKGNADPDVKGDIVVRERDQVDGEGGKKETGNGHGCQGTCDEVSV
jgi:hypothetical protein